jgi:TolB-like protein/tRNA A-37 threonylcarbamoyl transferase component Bud32
LLTQPIDHLKQALAGQFRVERELGGGGMSHVFLARELALDRNVVIKVVRADLLEGLSASRFTREVQLAARLQQANIVPLLAAGDAEGIPYYTMPFVDGESLRHRIDHGPPVPMSEGVGILRDVARALQFAHREGVVHRDIKPANVLLSGGTAVVTDFGIAKAVSEARTMARDELLTEVGMSVGTPRYMAPEQVAGDPGVGAEADLYAWGIMAWELLAGRHPFADATSPQGLMTAHLTRPVQRLDSLRPDVPAALADLVARCVTKEPTGRPGSAEAVLAELDAMDPAASTPATRALAGPASRGMRGGLLVLSLVVLVAAGGWWLWNGLGSGSDDASASTASIAVLPFRDLSPERESAYLGDGVAETLINALSTVPGITVSGRTSAFSFRDRESDLRAIGEQLDVSTVLLGSIQQAGGQLRVAARMVRIADDSILWSATFDRAAEDIFAVQDEVARSVTAALQPRVASGAAPALPRSEVGGTESAEAYNAYLLGRYHWNLRTTESMQAATAAFREALEADSLYALAWSGLADAYSLSIPSEYNVPGMSVDVALPLAEAAARRAIELAPELGEGYVSLGQVLSEYDRLDDALSAYERGLELSPAYPTGHQWYSYALLSAGRWEDGTRHMEIAHRLDPLAHVITLSLAVAYDGADRFAEAVPLYERGLAQSPRAWYAWRFRVAHHLAQGQMDRAADALRQATLDVRHPAHAAWQAVSDAWSDPQALDAIIDGLVAPSEWDLGITLTRGLRGEDAVLGYLRRLREEDAQIRSGTRWAAYALLGPRLRQDPAIRVELEALANASRLATPE